MSSALAPNPWRAPLLPLALAATAGIVADRMWTPPTWGWVLAAVAALAAWQLASGRKHALLALGWLWLAAAALGGAYHHWYRHDIPADDIGRLATDQPRLVQLRGTLVEPVSLRPARTSDPLRSFPAPARSSVTVQAGAVRLRDEWRPVSGNVRLTTPQSLTHLRPGDAIEVVGQLQAPDGPVNPGGFDYAGYLRDQHIGAVLVVRHEGQEILSRGRSPLQTGGLLLQDVRGWAGQVIDAWLGDQGQLARALLLGEQEALDQAEWDRYQRTGVVHVLAVSGQHLVVLAAFLALVFRLCQLPRRRVAFIVPVVLLGYSLLTGWRPPVQRSFFMVGSYYGAFCLRRVVLPANSFALAWLLVCVADPTSIFYAGCQLSFLASAVLLWGAGWFPAPHDPLDELLEQRRPPWQRLLRGALRGVWLTFLVGVGVWLAVAPLVASQFHMVSPVAIVVGVPVLLLTSSALLTGFLLLLTAPLLGPLAAPFAWFTYLALAGCEWLLHACERWPLAYWYVPDLPLWWLAVFYLILFGALLTPRLQQHRRSVLTALLLWVCLGLMLPLVRFGDGHLRCTFVAVGHGSCVVLELPDGRTLLYDAGSLSGPDVTRRHIAPFLWNRGIRRVDEVFLSHADLDHFNGLAALAEYFAIGRVSHTPSFTERDAAGVQHTLRTVAEAGIPLRVLKAGDRLDAGAVGIQVLHPTPAGPEGKENYRSLVLLASHADHSILLTGDLEGPGQERVLALPPVATDVLMAPHHGSAAANGPDLAKWAGARVVVSCQGPPRSPLARPDPYTPLGAIYLTTWQDGAVTVVSGADGLLVETYKGQQRWKIR